MTIFLDMNDAHTYAKIQLDLTLENFCIAAKKRPKRPVGK